jgi:hypothetical protein
MRLPLRAAVPGNLTRLCATLESFMFLLGGGCFGQGVAFGPDVAFGQDVAKSVQACPFA